MYVSIFTNSLIRVYQSDGSPVASFGALGNSVGEFVHPGGLWIDADNRLYVADAGNGRVQIFQLGPRR